METRAFQDWMVETALPLWAGAGRDAAGGFHEQLTLHGAPDAAASRRVRVQFRQIMVFCAAHSLGLRADGAAIARRAFDRVRKTAWAPDGQPGWIHRISAEGAPLDLSRRAVDQAFALLGLAWLRRPG
ncbi:MAG: AGE family epimerase/isomerase, partial [Pseudomonadota bacterium]